MSHLEDQIKNGLHSLSTAVESSRIAHADVGIVVPPLLRTVVMCTVKGQSS